jgi:hypothetical protein
MAFIPILPLFALELMAEASGVNSFTGLVACAAAAAAVFSSTSDGWVPHRQRQIVIAQPSAGLSFSCRPGSEQLASSYCCSWWPASP